MVGVGEVGQNSNAGIEKGACVEEDEVDDQHAATDRVMGVGVPVGLWGGSQSVAGGGVPLLVSLGMVLQIRMGKHRKISRNSSVFMDSYMLFRCGMAASSIAGIRSRKSIPTPRPQPIAKRFAYASSQ